MAAPDAPTDVAVLPGGSPESAKISWVDGGGGTPVSYEVYINNATGVSSTVYKGKRVVDVGRLFVEFEGIPYQHVYATVTGTNVDGTSADATEGSGWII